MKQSYLLHAFIMIVGLLLAAASVVATDFPLRSDLDGRGDLLIEIDQAQFLSGDPDANRLDVFYKIYNHGFAFTESEGSWTATYDINDRRL